MKTHLIFSFVFFSLLFSACASTETQLIDDDTEPQIISTEHQFTEGPYWHSDGYLLFSDIPANRIYRWDPETETSEVFLEPSGNSNGIQADINGNIILAQHAGRISRVLDNGTLEVIVDNYEGSRLNSPNDLTAHSNGSIYFTDPPFGVSDEDRELDFSGVYQITPDGELVLVYTEFDYPNGIVLSADESLLYVNDSETGDITVFDVESNGNLTSPRHFASVDGWGDNGAADGMVVDLDGRLYTTGPAGLSIFDAEGTHLQDIPFERSITNVEWSGENKSVMFITARDAVYRLQFNVEGYKPR